MHNTAPIQGDLPSCGTYLFPMAAHRFPTFMRYATSLNALGLVPVIVQQLPSVGQSVHGKVQGWMRICRSAIVLATADDESVVGEPRTRPNIEHEIGMLQTIPTIQNRIVYLKEPSVRFPSNYAEKVWIEFSRERVQDAFIPLIRELRAFAF
jgi:predicted nucleotide-binding protein